MNIVVIAGRMTLSLKALPCQKLMCNSKGSLSRVMVIDRVSRGIDTMPVVVCVRK
jgi:hypothetical protein